MRVERLERAVASPRAVWRCSRRVLLALLLGALALRLALTPLGAGVDFRAFAHLSWLTLHGHDVYALSRAQLHSEPWTYFPLCLDLFTALQWLAVHTGWTFRVLGKLPIIVADLAIGWLIYRALRRRGRSERTARWGMALYLFNPLALYNGAYYGRFDAIALAFLMLALDRYRTRLFAPAYALAIAAKIFPSFLLPLLLLGRERQRWRLLAAAGALVVVLALPYVLTDPRGLLHYLLYHARGGPGGRLSWYLLPLHRQWLSMAQAVAIARIGMLLYPLALLAAVRRPLYVKAAVGLALFVALDPTVYEQYLLWPLPFLIVAGLRHRSRFALGLCGLLTVAGMLENEYTWSHLRGMPLPMPWPPLNAALALAILLYAAVQLAPRRAAVRSSPASSQLDLTA